MFKTHRVVFIISIGSFLLCVGAAAYGSVMNALFIVHSASPLSLSDYLATSIAFALFFSLGCMGCYGAHFFMTKVPRTIIIQDDGTIQFVCMIRSVQAHAKDILSIRRAVGRYYHGLILKYQGGKIFVHSSMNEFSKFEQRMYSMRKRYALSDRR